MVKGEKESYSTGALMNFLKKLFLGLKWYVALTQALVITIFLIDAFFIITFGDTPDLPFFHVSHIFLMISSMSLIISYLVQSGKPAYERCEHCKWRFVWLQSWVTPTIDNQKKETVTIVRECLRCGITHTVKYERDKMFPLPDYDRNRSQWR